LTVALNGNSSSNSQVAVLRGTVATVELRQIAEQLALLEPGVSSVRNEIQVRPTASSDSPPDMIATPPSQNR
jgi:osmotically-inducible protein OsmY